MSKTPTLKEIQEIRNSDVREMCIVVLELGFWDKVSSDARFSGEELAKLESHPLIFKRGHSGGSFGEVYQQVKFIANFGVKYWRSFFDDPNPDDNPWW